MAAANTIYTRATSDAAVRLALSAIPETMRRGGPVADAVMARAGMALLGRIKQAFVVKARGGTDEAGDRWKPLSPKTIAYSKTRQRGRGGRTKAEKKRANFPSQALNTKQQDRWWAVYRRQLAIYKGNKSHAAAVAWLVLKREGAKTLLEKYGGRQVDILRDTGLLLNSLSPGVASPDRVFRVGLGEVVVGTNRKWAAVHHRGSRNGRIPRRRLWPYVNRWPQSWWTDILQEINGGIISLAASIVRGLSGG